MTMQDAATMLNADLTAVEDLLRTAGYRPFAELVGTGTTDGGRGVFVKFNAHGEEYIFTMSGPPEVIENLIASGHARIAPHVSQLRSLLRDSATTTAAGDSDHFIAGFQGRERDPRPRREADRQAFHEHTFSIQRRPDGLWSACVCIPTRVGPLYLCATADEHVVAQALQGELGAVSGDRSWVGSESYQAACGNIAQMRAFDRLGSALRNMVKDPGVQAVFATAVPMVPFVGPPASLAFQGAKLAMDLADKAEKGDPKARAAVAKIAINAKKGDPNAKRALDALKLGKQAKKLDKRNQEILLLQAENDDLRAKLDACQKQATKKWEEEPKEAAEDFLDQWGGSDEYIGLDLIQSAGAVLHEHAVAAGVSRQLATPIVSRYFRDRVSVGPMMIAEREDPEVGRLYHRPMREASEVALRRDYLRGQSIMAHGSEQPGYRWPRRA